MICAPCRYESLWSGPEQSVRGIGGRGVQPACDATRVRIILALRDKEFSFTNLANAVDKSPASVSQHLAKLRLARMVTARHEGTGVFYRLANEHAQQLVTDAILQAEHTLGGTPAHHAGVAATVAD
jgi:DNA-binding transcriptional ArsR family regulator